MSTARIPGPPLLGMSGLFVGAAAPPRPVIVVKHNPDPPPPAVKPGGKTLYGPAAKIPHNKTVEQHGKVLVKASQVLTQAKAVMDKALGAAAAHPRPAVLKPGAHVGAAPAPTGLPPNLTPKQKAAVAKHQAAMAKSDAAARTVQQKGTVLKAAVKTLADKALKQKDVAATLRKPKPSPGKGTHVGAEEAAALDLYYDFVGAGPDPAYPGYLTDGSLDPAILGDAVPVNPNNPPDPNNPGFLMDGSSDPNSAGTDPGDPTGQDNGATLPPAPDARTPIADLVAAGAIMYDGSRGYPPGFMGSAGYFLGNSFDKDGRRYGFVFGGDRSNPAWPGEDPTAWIWVHGKKGDSGSVPDFPGAQPGLSGWWDNAYSIDNSLNSYAAVQRASVNKTYGPLIGNPSTSFQGGAFAGLRCDSNGNLGWLPQEAPTWVTFPMQQAAAVTAQAAQKAAADAAAADAATAAKAQADAAAAQAQQDAQNALAESQAQSDANVAQMQQQGQQAAQETQANDILLKQAQQGLQQQAQGGDDGGGDDGSDGGDDGSGDDGSDDYQDDGDQQ